MATQTLTFLFADIKGSAAMSRRLEDAYAGGQAEPARARLGIDSGEASRTAARLEAGRAPRIAVAYGGQVVVPAAAGLLRDARPAGGWLTNLGQRWLAGEGRAGQVFQRAAAGLPARFVPPRSLEGVRQC